MKFTRLAAVVAALIIPAVPVSAMVPVIDVAAIAQMAAQVQQQISTLEQTLILVQTAKQNLQALPSEIGMSNIQGRISGVTSILQQARGACQGVLTGRVLPKVCQVEANTADAQAEQLGSEMTQVQALQSAANGVNGGLAAQQLQAKSLVEVAMQLQELRQAQNATQQQQRIDEEHLEAALHGKPSVTNPYGP